jgi:hypothetical protein
MLATASVRLATNAASDETGLAAIRGGAAGLAKALTRQNQYQGALTRATDALPQGVFLLYQKGRGLPHLSGSCNG